MTERGAPDFALYRRVLRWARPWWGRIAGMLFLALLSTPIALLTPIPLKIVLDHVLGDESVPGWLAALAPGGAAAGAEALLAVAVGLLVSLALLRQLLELASAWLHTDTGQRMMLAFRARLLDHAQRLSLAFHDSRGTSESIYRIQWDAPAIQHIAVNGVIPFITSIVMVVAMIVVTARIDGTLALIAMVVAPALYLLTRGYRRPLRRRYAAVKGMESSALAVVQEVLSALRVVKAFGAEERERDRFMVRSGESVRAHSRLALFQGGFDLLLGLTTALGTALVLWFGVQHVRAGALTVGELFVVMAYLTQLYAPLRTMSGKVADLQASLASADRAFALLDERPDVPEQPDARPMDRAEGRVEFCGVGFAYASDRPVLEDVSFVAPAGARVGLSGRTGAGKSTLIHLLVRFYDPDRGAVLLDGIDLRDLRLADLRDQFAIVLQDPVLFSTSIAENIAYARPGAATADIETAARAAGVHEFIAGLPRGYETPVGERGLGLSGGERQRISLARAFLKDAPILILDEPTSSVDVATEAGIMEAMERLMAGRTTFMIAHRLSTLEGCDVRLEVREGRVRPIQPRPATV